MFHYSLFSLLGLLLFAVAIPPEVQETPDDPWKDCKLSGIYSVVGSADPGTGYTGTAQIRKLGDGYQVMITTATLIHVVEDGKLRTKIGQFHVVGVGALNGKTFSVAWADGKSVGITVYEVDGDRLTGFWMPTPGARKYPETLKKLSGIPTIPTIN